MTRCTFRSAISILHFTIMRTITFLGRLVRQPGPHTWLVQPHLTMSVQKGPTLIVQQTPFIHSDKLLYILVKRAPVCFESHSDLLPPSTRARANLEAHTLELVQPNNEAPTTTTFVLPPPLFLTLFPHILLRHTEFVARR